MEENKHYRVNYHGTIDLIAKTESEVKERFENPYQKEGLSDSDLANGINTDDLEIEEIIP